MAGRRKTPNQAFRDLKSKIFDGPQNTIIRQVDNTLDRVSDAIINKDNSRYVELMRKVLGDTLGDNEYLTKNTTSLDFLSPENVDRLGRYANSDDICDSITYCARALKVLADEIVSPDDITKEVLQFLESEGIRETERESISNVKTINRVLEIEDCIHDIVFDTLKYGDQFIELCDYTNKEVPLTQSLLNEAKSNDADARIINELTVLRNSDEYRVSYRKLDESGEPTADPIETTVKINIFEDKSEEERLDIDNVRLIIHDPSHVIKLQSSRFKLCLGYLVVPKMSATSSGNQLGMTSYGLSNSQAAFRNAFSGSGFFNQDYSGIDKIYDDILKLVKRKLESEEVNIDSDENEFKSLLTRLISEYDKNKREIKIRFVPAHRMEHFTINNRRFFPYGESIFYKSTFSAKLLIAFQTALVIKRISDSSDKQVVYFENNMPRDARNTIEEVKQKLRKKRFSMNTMGSVSSVPSMITNYETYYIPQKNGTRMIDFEPMQPSTNLRDISEELRMFRDFLVSGLEVPPAYLNIEENLCISLYTNIPLTNGTTITLKQLIEEHESGVEHELYSYDHDLGVVFPNKVKWAGKTKLDTEVVRVWLDNDEYIDCTPDHKFMLRDGTYKEAKDLQENESVMPLYIKDSYMQTVKDKHVRYPKIYHPGINKWQLIHRSFATYLDMYSFIEEENINYRMYPVHHINENIMDNSSDNIAVLSIDEHMKIHNSKHADDLEVYNAIKYRHDNHRSWDNPKILNTEDVEEVCKICGTLFIREKCLNKVTCSKKCSNEYSKSTGYKSWKSREKKLRQKFPIIEMNCGWCGKKFEMSKRSNFDENKLYSCGDKTCSKFLRGYNISMSKFKGVTYYNIEYRICGVCGETFIYSPEDKSKKLEFVCRNMKCINTVLAMRNAAIQKLKSRVDLVCRFCGEEFWRYHWYMDNLKHEPTCGKPECYAKSVSEIVKARYTNMKKEKAKTGGLNHKVVKVEFLTERMDTGDITVDKYHNFATAAGVFVHNSNKAALSFENILFTRTIIGYQHRLSKSIHSLFNKIHKFTYNKDIPRGINIQFSPPKMLQVERDSEHIGTVVRIINDLRELQIPVEYLKKKYLPFDWDDLKRFEDEEELNKISGDKKEDDGMGGGMGGGQW